MLNTLLLSQPPARYLKNKKLFYIPSLIFLTHSDEVPPNYMPAKTNKDVLTTFQETSPTTTFLWMF